MFLCVFMGKKMGIQGKLDLLLLFKMLLLSFDISTRKCCFGDFFHKKINHCELQKPRVSCTLQFVFPKLYWTDM